MNAIMKCMVFLQLLVQIISVASYTVVLKQVKPLYPPVKVYRYELRHAKVLPESTGPLIYSKPFLGQRIYPVVVKPGLKTRAPLKNGKLYKVSSTTEKPVLKNPPLLGISQHLVPPVSNQIEEFSEAKEEEIREEENDIRPLVSSPHSSKSFSSFGQDKGRVYNNPGEWATTLAPQINSENTTKPEFTPSQLYLQIRHKNTVIHVPQSEALKDAETLEELINAPRLKQLSRTTHVQETYSEEGYEDAGYDHAGHLRQAQHGEVYDAKDEGRFNIKEPPVILDYDSDLEESKKIPLKNPNNNLVPAEGNLSNKLEPRITRSRSEVSKTSMELTNIPKNYKGEHKYSSRVKNPVKTFYNQESQLNSTNTKEFPAVQATFPSYFGEMPPPPENIIANDSFVPYNPPIKKSSKYRKGDLNSTKIYPISDSTIPPVKEYTDFKPYISIIDSQASPSAKSLKYSRIYSKKTKQLRLEPYKNDNIYSPPPPPPPPPLPSSDPPPQDLQPPQEEDETEKEESINQRIVLPTIGYINSLTTAHFGKESSKPVQEERKPQLTDALNLTQALNYLRNNKNQQNQEVTKSPTEIDIRTFEPMKIKKSRSGGRSKSKRDVFLIGKRSGTNVDGYEGNDESDLPHNEKNEEIDEDERKRIEEENQEKEKYEQDLKSEISEQEKEIIKETYKNIGVEDDISEVFPQFPSSDSEFDSSSIPLETTPTPVDIRKYPFYKSKKLPENSALRYATDPKQFPKKSGYKMEFYESREQLIQCPDFHPDLDDIPDSNSTQQSDEQAGENQRLSGLGDKIACLRMKYFDPEPFDNPIFKEREIDYVGKHGRIKTQSKVMSKIVKPQEPIKSYNDKVKNQKLSQSPRTNYLGQPTNQEIKNHSAETSKVLANSIKANKSGTQINKFAKTPENTSVPRTSIGWKTVYRSPHATPKPETRKQIKNSHNCLPHISQLAVLDGISNVSVECNDVILIQDVRGNVPYLKIIPKERKTNRKIFAESSNQTDWVPIVGYPYRKHAKSGKPLSRRTDEVTKQKNETTENTSSGHYVIDELKEDENVRKGEVVEDMAHYLKLMEDFKNEITTVKPELKPDNSTRRKRDAQNKKKDSNFSKILEFSLDKALQTQSLTKGENNKTSDEVSISRPFPQKRPLKRISGLDFLVRYHKNKAKNLGQKTEDFWKVTTKGPTIDKSNIVKQSPSVDTEEREKKTTTSQIASDFRKRQTKSSLDKLKKSSSRQISRKISSSNQIPDNVTKKPTGKPETYKTTTQNSILEKTTAKPINFTKIITKVSTETSETSEKPRIIYKQTKPNQSSTTETPPKKPEVLQYKTINRNSGSFQNPENENSSEGPTLYYIVNLKTGRGKWITHYDDKLRNSKKHQKTKEISGPKKEKRKKI